MSYDWRDGVFTRQQSQRLAHQQPLEGLEYDTSWPPTWQWALMGLILGAALVWGLCS